MMKFYLLKFPKYCLSDAVKTHVSILFPLRTGGGGGAEKVALPRRRLHELLSNDGGPPRRSGLAAGLYTCWFKPKHRTGVHPMYARVQVEAFANPGSDPPPT